MILSKTPLRISLFGGGTDLPEFFTRASGAVVSFAISKNIYVGVNEKFDGRTRVSYSKTENVDSIWKLEHDLVRETLAHFRVKGVEITSVSDIPGEGSGLGSSSAFIVGLVTALTGYLKRNPDPRVCAQLGYAIERNSCGHPVGKQDHYAAALGGLHYYQFNPDGSVDSERVPITPTLKSFLEENIMLFWTGRSRKADGILREQAKNLKGSEAFETGLFLSEAARECRRFLADESFYSLGQLMDRAWRHKKRLARVSDNEIDNLYHRAKQAGAIGGKICGAGGGGFLMLIADSEVQRAIEEAVGLRRVRFCVEECGSQVVYKD